MKKYLPYNKAYYIRTLLQKANKYKDDEMVKHYIKKINTDNNLTIDNWCKKLELQLIICKNR